MSKATLPNGPRGLADTNAEQRSSLRERVRQHMLKMAPLALVGAVPLINTACDCIPTPACNEYYWTSRVSAQAAWGLDHGSRIVIVDLISTDDELAISPAYSISGGSLLTVGKSKQLRIKPDEGATVIRMHGSLTCGGDRSGSDSLDITIELVPPDGGSTDGYPAVKISG